jgi:hypothetical protein
MSERSAATAADRRSRQARRYRSRPDGQPSPNKASELGYEHRDIAPVFQALARNAAA